MLPAFGHPLPEQGKREGTHSDLAGGAYRGDGGCSPFWETLLGCSRLLVRGCGGVRYMQRGWKGPDEDTEGLERTSPPPS